MLGSQFAITLKIQISHAGRTKDSFQPQCDLKLLEKELLLVAAQIESAVRIRQGLYC